MNASKMIGSLTPAVTWFDHLGVVWSDCNSNATPPSFILFSSRSPYPPQQQFTKTVTTRPAPDDTEGWTTTSKTMPSCLTYLNKIVANVQRTKSPQFAQNLVTIWRGQIVVLETPSFGPANWWLNGGFLISAGEWLIRPKFTKKTAVKFLLWAATIRPPNGFHFTCVVPLSDMLTIW
jgi:hypothetical protein